MVSGPPQLTFHTVTNSLTPRNQDAYCGCHTSQQMSVDSRATGISSSVAQGIADMAQSWAHLARDIAPQVPELPAVIQQEVASLRGIPITEDSVNQVARLITRRVEEAGHPDLAAALLRRMGRAMYELLLLLATEEELRAMGMLMQATKAPGLPASNAVPAPGVGATPSAAPAPNRPSPATPSPVASLPSARGPEPAARRTPATTVAAAGPQLSTTGRPAPPGAGSRAQPPGVGSLPPVSPGPGRSSNPAAVVKSSPALPDLGSRDPAGALPTPRSASHPATLPPPPGTRVSPVGGPVSPVAGPPSAPPRADGQRPLPVVNTVPPAPPVSMVNQPAVPPPGEPSEGAVLWGFDPAARETDKAGVTPSPEAAPPTAAASEPALAVEAKVAEQPRTPVMAAPVGAEPIGSGARRWSVRLSPKAQAERDSRLEKRLGELPPLLEEIAAQVHEQRRAVAEKGQARAAVRSSSEQSAPADLPTASNLMTDLLGAGRLVDAAALAMRAAEAFPGQVAAELACRAGEACRESKDEDLAVLCFTTAVLTAPPCEAACWQLAGMALEQREPRLAPIWIEFLARLLRVRGADEDAVVIYRQLLNLTPRRQDVRDILRVASLTGTLPD